MTDMTPTRNEMKLAKKLITQVVYLHGCHVKNLTGIDINVSEEENRLYNMFLGGQITIQEIRDDITEYKVQQMITEIYDNEPTTALGVPRRGINMLNLYNRGQVDFEYIKNLHSKIMKAKLQ